MSIAEPLHRLIVAGRCLRSRGRGATAHVLEEDPRAEEARRSIVAAREQQARDGRAAGRAVFTELGFVKARWEM